jgi:hypothetical protein
MTVDFEIEKGRFPLLEELVWRDKVVTFATQFVDGLPDGFDAAMMHMMELGDCASGAGSYPVHPFVAEIPPGNAFATGRDVLDVLKAKNFRSEHIPSLDETTIEHPGYNPDSDNDEIHNDFSKQFVFAREEEDDETELSPDDGAHGLLKDFVMDDKLWYALLHADPDPKYGFSHWVVLLVVGRSLEGRCVGVVTRQSCHNLCD